MRNSIPVLCIIGLLLPMLTGPSTAAEPELWLWGPGGSPADIEREVLWLDNPDFSGIVCGSEVIGSYGLWSETANDFVFDDEITIRRVTWWGAYWNGYDGTPTGAGFNLRFYDDSGNCLPEDAPFVEYLLPGDDCCETLADGGDQFSHFVYEFCLEQSLPPGVHWFSAQMADHDFPPQWGRVEADAVQSCESATRSPYFGYPDWVPISALMGNIWPRDYSQMLEDECEPTTVVNTSWGAVKGLYR